jgi:hypothetical protein
MSAAFRSHGKGTLVLKGTFGGIRIERASGTNDPKRLTDLQAMCRSLAERGRGDILEAMAKPRGLRPLDVWRHSGDWSRIPTPEHARTLATALEEWRRTIRNTERRYKLQSLIRVFLAGDTRSTVGHLPGLLLAYRTRCEQAGTARKFNLTRAEWSAFLRDTVTRAHPLWLQLRAIARLAETRKQKGNPQLPAQACAIAAALGDELGQDWLSLCATGMMPDEYFGGKWQVEDGRLRVVGTKTAGKTTARDRYVPQLLPLRMSLVSQDRFTKLLKRSGLGVRPYDGRRTFKHWCDLVGIPGVRSEIYMGHETKYRMDTLYGTHESERLLERDEAALRKLLAKVVGFPVGTKRAKSRKSNAPSRDRTCDPLIKSQSPQPADVGQARKQADLADPLPAHTPPKDPDDHP